MVNKLFFTLGPLYAHFRLTVPTSLKRDDRDESIDSDYLLSSFDGHRYTASYALTLLDNRVLFLKDYYQALSFEFTQLAALIEQSPSSQDALLDSPFTWESLSQEYNLDPKRLDEEAIIQETEDWIEAAREHGASEVAELLEEYLTEYVTKKPNPSRSLNLRTQSSSTGQMLDSLQAEFGGNVGTVLAAGVSWYDSNADGLDVADRYPIIATGSSVSYLRREDFYELLRSVHPGESYQTPEVIKWCEVNV